MMTNAYPELPIVPYQKTVVSMDEVIAALNASPFSLPVKIAGYVIFRNESLNGTKGLNNNYVGAQADSGRWSGDVDKYFSGVVQKTENKTGKLRLFLAFHSLADCIGFLLTKIQSRGLYLGGTTTKITKQFIATKVDWALAYERTWVTGKADAVLDETTENNLISMYNAGLTRIK